jgi:hypothetical protein
VRVIDATGDEQKSGQAEPAKRPAFTFRRALPLGMEPDEARQQCERAIRELAEGARR